MPNFWCIVCRQSEPQRWIETKLQRDFQLRQTNLFDTSKLYDSNCVGAKTSTGLIILTCAVLAHEFSRFANFPSAENVTSFVSTVFG